MMSPPRVRLFSSFRGFTGAAIPSSSTMSASQSARERSSSPERMARGGSSIRAITGLLPLMQGRLVFRGEDISNAGA